MANGIFSIHKVSWLPKHNNRFGNLCTDKLQVSPQEQYGNAKPNDLDNNPSDAVQVGFNLLSLRLVPESFHSPNSIEKISENHVGDGDTNFNSLDMAKNSIKLCPSPAFVAATSDKLYCVNWKSGTPEFIVSYLGKIGQPSC